MKYRKQYIDVDVAISASGQMLPRIIHWTDGRKYTISKVKAIVPSPALKAGGQGDRYTVMLENQERYLFFERPTDSDDASMVGRWFVAWLTKYFGFAKQHELSVSNSFPSDAIRILWLSS